MREMEALILCHSVMVVMRPMAKSMRYILSSALPKESSAGSTPVPLRMPSAARAMLSKRLIEVRTMAGMMAMDISKQLQLPRATPRSRPEPYRPKTCRKPRDQRSL